MRKKFLYLFGDSKRQQVMVSILAILMSLIVSSIIIILTGKNPINVYKSLLQGVGFLKKSSYATYKGQITDFVSMINALTPMILASLGVAIAFKAGLFNIGISGQMLFAGFVSTITVGYVENFSPFIAKPLVVIIGLLAGGIVGAFIGFLKYKLNINEVVSSIMTNYIIMYIVSFLINTKYVDPVSRQSKTITQASRLTLLDVVVGNYKVDIPLGIILAIVAIIIINFILNKTKQGYEIKAIGLNKDASLYAGINVSANVIRTMFISGALAGLAGVCYYLGYYGTIRPKVLAPLGFDSIAVSLLGNSNPIAIFFSSLLITGISGGSTYMSSTAGVPQEFASVITGIILIFTSCSQYIRYVINKNLEK